MKKILLKSLFLSVIIMIPVIFSCKKDKTQDVDKPLVFESLTSEKDTILLYETTIVTAVADGDEIEYIWSADMGNINGGGSSVTYIPTPCVAGNVLVTCTVRDKGNNKLTKTITIFVQV